MTPNGGEVRSTPSELRSTQYGFDWGPLSVERIAHIEGRGYVVSVRGPRGYDGPEVQVYVSEAGRVVRAYPIRGAKVR